MSHADAIDYCREYGILDEEALTFEHPLVRALADGEDITMSFSQTLEGAPDDELAEARHEAQQEANAEAAAAAPERQKLLDEYKRPSAGAAYPF
jgi:hypothetical protein